MDQPATFHRPGPKHPTPVPTERELAATIVADWPRLGIARTDED